MTKKVISRFFLGFPLGVFISYTITIIISLAQTSGSYYSAAPQLIAQTGSELDAILLQYLLGGMLGAVSGAGSVAWEVPHWNLLKQSAVHFFLLAGSMFAAAWFSWWMPHTLAGALSYMILFFILYAIIFVILYFSWRNKIKEIDSRIQQKKSKA
jgi:Protein of unknown function (DUF3021).